MPAIDLSLAPGARLTRSLTWISPCGRRHRTEPFDYRPFTDDLPPGAASAAAGEAVAAGDRTEEEPPL